jgi:hypothetical protein
MAQRQYSLLQAANLLTPDMITEFETLQRLVQEEKTEPGVETSRTPGPAREASQTQDLWSESVSRVLRPCDLEHGKATEWSHTRSGDSTGA